METISARTADSPVNVELNKYPDTCPYCHHSGSFQRTSAAVDRYFLYISFYCGRHECGHFFVYSYERDNYKQYQLARPINGTPKGVHYSDSIKGISSNFVEIYKQAEQAEAIGLKDICGVGYRKALEFLIKDYIIYLDPSTKADVENKLLAKCIGDHIKNPQIVDISKRAVWLGNDETHYIRKWEGMDISHLKQLIALTVHWIETEELTKKMIADMPDPKKP